MSKSRRRIRATELCLSAAHVAMHPQGSLQMMCRCTIPETVRRIPFRRKGWTAR